MLLLFFFFPLINTNYCYLLSADLRKEYGEPLFLEIDRPTGDLEHSVYENKQGHKLKKQVLQVTGFERGVSHSVSVCLGVCDSTSLTPHFLTREGGVTVGREGRIHHMVTTW